MIGPLQSADGYLLVPAVLKLLGTRTWYWPVKEQPK